MIRVLINWRGTPHNRTILLVILEEHSVAYIGSKQLAINSSDDNNGL